jgi:hypothetical protein
MCRYCMCVTMRTSKTLRGKESPVIGPDLSQIGVSAIKAALLIVAVGKGLMASPGAEVSVAATIIVEAPPVTSNSFRSFDYGSLGVSGTNAVFMWSHPSGKDANDPDLPYQKHSLFMSRLDENGRPSLGVGRFVTSMFYGSGGAYLYPMESGLFIAYPRVVYSADGRFSGEYSATAIDFDGHVLFDPIPVEINQFKTSHAASNGRVFLWFDDVHGISYISLNRTGKIVSTGQFSAAEHSFAVATDGANFISLWSGGPGLRELKFSKEGAPAVSTPITNIISTGMFETCGHGDRGYLLITGDLGLAQFSDDGSFVAKATAKFAIGPRQVVYGEGEGWVVFSMTNGILRSLRVTSTKQGLQQELDPYPIVNGVYWGGGAVPPLDTTVVPFGTERFLFLTTNGVSVLTKNGMTAPAFPQSYIDQTNSCVIGSPFGYLATWREAEGVGGKLRALRMAPDGTPLDTHSIEIASVQGNFSSTCIFDGEDYVIGWSEGDGVPSTHIARISPFGIPDVRGQQIALATDPNRFSLLAMQGKLYAWYSQGPPTNSNLHIFPLATSGALGQEITVRGQSLATDQVNLYSVGLETNTVFATLIKPGDSQPEGVRTTLGAGSSARGVSLRDGFAVVWNKATNQWDYAYFTNGVEQFRSTSSFPTEPQVASSQERLLMAWRSNSTSHQFFFQSINFVTAETATNATNLGTVSSLNLASAGRDFFGVTDSLGLQAYFVGGFWVADAGIPTFATTKINDSGLKALLTLNPDRRYRIETSEDLLNWNIVDVVSGESDHEVSISGGEKEFSRAVLVPE